MEELRFDDITLIEVPVSIGGKKYVLREATGDAACKYRNALLKSTRLGPDGKPIGIDGMADSEPLLVSLCLFEVYEVNGDERTRPVTLLQVRAWKQRVQKTLYAKVKEISELNEGEDTVESLEKQAAEVDKKLQALRNGHGEDAAKNELCATGNTSR